MRDHLSHGVPIRPEPAGKILVDDDDLRAVGVVAFVEEAAGPQRDLHRLQVMFVHDAGKHQRDLVWIENLGVGGMSARTSRADTFNAWREQNTSFEAAGLAPGTAAAEAGRRRRC